jgi:hypothetical protein
MFVVCHDMSALPSTGEGPLAFLNAFLVASLNLANPVVSDLYGKNP